jgi:hypothetical protein
MHILLRVIISVYKSSYGEARITHISGGGVMADRE